MGDHSHSGIGGMASSPEDSTPSVRPKHTSPMETDRPHDDTYIPDEIAPEDDPTDLGLDIASITLISPPAPLVEAGGWDAPVRGVGIIGGAAPVPAVGWDGAAPRSWSVNDVDHENGADGEGHETGREVSPPNDMKDEKDTKKAPESTKQRITTLNTALDTLMSRLLSSIDAYESHRKVLSTLLSGGYFDLSSARQALGGSPQLTPLKYDMRMKCTRGVIVEEADTAYGEATEVVVEFTENVEKPAEGVVDPMRWFAALPPAPLRSAQTQFVKAVQRCICLANASREIDALRVEIAQKKKELDALDGSKIAKSTDARRIDDDLTPPPPDQQGWDAPLPNTLVMDIQDELEQEMEDDPLAALGSTTWDPEDVEYDYADGCAYIDDY
ncbi:uncharacterized protein EV422DRAFT_513492 [Fimicolochytrium jonesii]|uniref:uncharacterized protein n=1 Tax=Fimicolochytrium jonesii TaxID=1396493 RepID=UPI0022FEF5EA|nr:uncharacterized protein EV422DRAFT_513492 [Fimicolochytrium jonesii]KAI8825604.1 hypothetical protein EV422DRAFT_513492 [Fimicolochytrium jonesii]